MLKLLSRLTYVFVMMTWFSFSMKSSSSFLIRKTNLRSIMLHHRAIGSITGNRIQKISSACKLHSQTKSFGNSGSDKRSFSSRQHVHGNQSQIESVAIERDSSESSIYALSSGGGGSTATAVSVIRITGPEAHEVLKVLMSKSQAAYDNTKLPQARYASLRMIYDPNVNLEGKGDNFLQKEFERIRDPLDSSLVLLFNSPASFTGEDMVEIHTHGSRAVVQGVLSALNHLSEAPYNMNIRPAERGEFTQRAYGKGKLGLLEVEALADLIVADTSFQRLQALRQLDGRLSNLYENWRKELIKGLAHAEAVIDFGDDEDLEEGSDNGELNVWGGIKPRMEELRTKMLRHLADSQRGEILRDGVKVCLQIFIYLQSLIYKYADFIRWLYIDCYLRTSKCRKVVIA